MNLNTKCILLHCDNSHVVNVLAALSYCLTFTWLLVEDGGLGWQINPQRAKIDFPLQNSSRIEEMVCTSTSERASESSKLSWACLAQLNPTLESVKLWSGIFNLDVLSTLLLFILMIDILNFEISTGLLFCDWLKSENIKISITLDF